MSLDATLLVRVESTLSNALDMETAVSKLDQSFQRTMVTGSTGSGVADQRWSDERTLASATPETLDFNAGGLSNALGVVFTIARLKVLAVVADATNTTNLTLTGTLPFITGTTSGVAPLEPGAVLFHYHPLGVLVTGTTNDSITVTNGSGAAAKYKIIVIGSTA